MIKNVNTNTEIQNIFRLNPKQKETLKKMGIETVAKIIKYFPIRYGNAGLIKSIEFLNTDEDVVIFGKIKNLKSSKTFKTKLAISEATIEDSTGKVRAVWFNQPYISKMFKEGELVRIEGKVSEKNTKTKEQNILTKYFSNPKIEKVSKIPEGTSDSLFKSETIEPTPIYSESNNISSLWIYHTIKKLFNTKTILNNEVVNLIDLFEDPIPKKILQKYNLPSLKSALIWVHQPKNKNDAEIARKRFAFEEIFMIQLDRQKEKMLAEKENAFAIKTDAKEINNFISGFQYSLTNSQQKVIDILLENMRKSHPMSRLLEGDVGSGKTAIAMTISFATIKTPPPNRKFGALQVGYMAPTEILAEQHFNSFIESFKKHKINIGLITSSGAKKFPSKSNKEAPTKISKNQLLKWVENGEISILIGTHSLIQKKVKFKNLGLIIIDEQHRFGVKQRKLLRGKSDIAPHLLSMTATPIPRTLALTLFGDLDLSILDELPKGRQFPETKIVLPQERELAYEKIKEELKNGRQAYIICPKIEDSDPNKILAINAKSVKSEVERLQKNQFKDYEIVGLTGKNSPSEKEKIMSDFKNNKIDILVATTVVEVGVNVPNATIMIIENAERFGLSQLHQLRGRILRSSHKPYCFVFAETKSQKTITRLKSFVNAKNGFELAEADLQQRGAGDLIGIKQWGVSDLAMEALKNIKMVEFAKEEAKKIIEEDFELKKYPLLKTAVEDKIHFE